MISLLFIAAITLIGSLTAVIRFGLKGVLISSLISAIIGVTIRSSLDSFGSPPGAITRFNIYEFLLSIVVYFIMCFFIYYGVYLIKTFFSKDSAPRFITALWLGIILVSGFFYIGYLAYR
jgi:predicted neutral ceramidase superfamily lipid hydrolase